MSFQQRLMDDMKAAMRDGNGLKLSVVRLLRSSIKNKEIAKGKGQSLTEQEFLETVSSAVKQRKDSIEQFTKGGRMDLVSKEKEELKILQEYLPRPLTAEEFRAKAEEVIREVGANSLKDLGKVMKALMPLVTGKVDGSEASKVVKDLLTKAS